MYVRGDDQLRWWVCVLADRQKERRVPQNTDCAWWVKGLLAVNGGSELGSRGEEGGVG